MTLSKRLSPEKVPGTPVPICLSLVVTWFSILACGGLQRTQALPCWEHYLALPNFQRPHFVFFNLSTMSDSPKSLPSGLPKANSPAHPKMCLIISCFYASPFRSNISHRNLYSGLQPSFHSLITSRSGHSDVEWENEYLHHDFQISLKGNVGILHDPHIQMPLSPDNWSVTVDRTWIGEHPHGPNT